MLLYESKLYKILAAKYLLPDVALREATQSAQTRKLPPDAPIGNVWWYGVEGDYNVMAMDLLGPSLEDMFNYCGRKFSLKTVLLLADQLIERIEFMHSACFIHRSIKPENFLMTPVKDHADKVKMIDFGRAKKYCDPKTGIHDPFRENVSFAGAPYFASVNAHRGVALSRRDDLISLGFFLIYFLKEANLPWPRTWLSMRGRSGQPDIRKRIGRIKEATSLEALCKDLPTEFLKYLKHCTRLAYAEKPDYDHLRKLFSDLFQQEGFTKDKMFDWHVQYAQFRQTQGLHINTLRRKSDDGAQEAHET